MIPADPALKRLLDVFERLGIEFFAGGSLASSVHGIPRATLDIDLVARLGSDHVDRLTRELQGEFYVDPDMIRDALAAGRPFNLIHLASSYKFGIFPLRNEPFEVSEFERRQFQAVPQLGEEVRLPLASAEDIVLAKLLWFRQGGEVSQRQWDDARGVVEVQRDRLDRAYLDAWARKLGISELLARLLTQTGITR